MKLHILISVLLLFGSAAAWWQPRPKTSWEIQLQGTIDTTKPVQAYDIDLFDVPASTIAALKAQGKKVICYFSAGTYEQWRPDAGSFAQGILGSPLGDWPGERWLDIRNFQTSGLATVMTKRFDLAVQKRCDAVDMDNVDGFTQKSGFSMTYQDQLSYNKWLASQAHARGLAAGLKNDLRQIKDLVPFFDFLVDESCTAYDECGMLKPFVDAGKAVFGISYPELGGKNLQTYVCPVVNALNYDWVIKNRLLGAQPLVQCRSYSSPVAGMSVLSFGMNDCPILTPLYEGVPPASNT